MKSKYALTEQLIEKTNPLSYPILVDYIANFLSLKELSLLSRTCQVMYKKIYEPIGNSNLSIFNKKLSMVRRKQNFRMPPPHVHSISFYKENETIYVRHYAIAEGILVTAELDKKTKELTIDFIDLAKKQPSERHPSIKTTESYDSITPLKIKDNRMFLGLHPYTIVYKNLKTKEIYFHQDFEACRYLKDIFPLTRVSHFE